jgi:choline dehydrogenase-like flavoprotein
VIIDGRHVESGAVLSADIAVVGAGPAGIVTALELAQGGLEVLVLESGGERFDSGSQLLAEASDWDSRRHAPMSMTSRRQLGGTSVIWGGRCVPYDPVDFAARDGRSDWPVSYDELTPFFQRACDWLVCGRAAFDGRQLSHLSESLAPGLPNEDVRTCTFERWSLPTDFGKEYGPRLRAAGRIRLITGLTCTMIVCHPDESRVQHLEARGLDGRAVRVRARRYVLAGGGLETTRLLLASPGRNGRPVGDHSGHLGRWYMGHVEGGVARIRLNTPPAATIFGYERDIDGVYVRRRFSFTAEAQERLGLPNIVAWLANPDLADPSHASGVLSFAYLALASPLGRVFAPDAQRLSLTGRHVPGAPYGPVERGPVREHLRNLMRDAGPAASFIARFGTQRFLARRRKVPGFFVFNPANVYPLQFHGEHLPRRESSVTLGEDRDSLGMPRLRIGIEFSQADVDGVLKAHRHWDEYLRAHGCGWLEYRSPDVAGSIWEGLGGGFHQMGTTRMSANSEDGVLGADLSVHGFDDLFAVSSSAFASSSQANSTFMIVVFALRLADHLRAELCR